MGVNQKTSYKCDRCSREDLEPDFKRQETWTKIERACSAYSHDKFLLCDACAVELEKWMGLMPKVTMTDMGGGPYR